MSGNINDVVTLVITEDSSGIARAGFGIPLILSHTAAWVERIRFYGALLDVASDFTTDSAEYLAARAAFSQNPHPTQIAIGRGANKPTQQYTISVGSLANTTAYIVSVSGKGFTGVDVTYTSDGSATNDEIVSGLVSALNAVPSKTFTAVPSGSAGFTVCVVTGDAAGNWFSIDLASTTLLKIGQTHVDPGVAADLDAISLQDSSWYALTTLYNSKAYVLAAAAWTEAQSKIYLVDVNETDAINTVLSGAIDTLATLKGFNYRRTAGSYHPVPGEFMSSAWLGRVLPIDPGSDDWKFKALAGVESATLTGTNRTNLRARSANTLETIAGRVMTWEGTVASGDFIDNTRGLDWLQDDMQKGVFGALGTPNKTPFTDGGIAVVQNEVLGSLKRAVALGILVAGSIDCTVPRAKDVSAADKAARRLTGVKFVGQIAGAIHFVALAGTVSV